MRVTVQIHAQPALPPVKGLLVPVEWGLRRLQGWSEFFGEERNLLLCGESNHEPSVVKPVA
jgi:hypothetical protein